MIKLGIYKEKAVLEELAEFYWLLVKEVEGANMEFWLEKIYLSFNIHISNREFEAVWERVS
ncbi:MAG: hypothetical protein D6B27_11865 [Gammaproteobacteria bacterium]|nr:MAG: hypothetical protein D6B27_11865 [Gammaproteobacteria bacterium]